MPDWYPMSLDTMACPVGIVVACASYQVAERLACMHIHGFITDSFGWGREGKCVAVSEIVFSVHLTFTLVHVSNNSWMICQVWEGNLPPPYIRPPDCM